jgi:hypothetical protein
MLCCSVEKNRKAHLPAFNSEENDFVGNEAYQKVTSILHGYPLAQRLAGEVYGFYGDYLHYRENRNFTSTIFTIRLQHQPIALQSAEIQLQLETGRLGEALCHELLHLHLFRLGFPLGEFVEIPFPFVYYARDLLGMCHWLLNVVQHELNYQSFIALGFDKDHFLFRSDEIIDYRQRFNSELQNGYPPEVDFPRWCIEHLRHFFAARHGGGGNSLDQAQDALAWGSRLYPN